MLIVLVVTILLRIFAIFGIALKPSLQGRSVSYASALMFRLVCAFMFDAFGIPCVDDHC